jgi:hypothetical protein
MKIVDSLLIFNLFSLSGEVQENLSLFGCIKARTKHRDQKLILPGTA